MTDLVSTIDSDYDKLDKNAGGLANALTGGGRAAPKIADDPGEFHNALDLASPDGPQEIKATPHPGGVTVTSDTLIEFIHFGRTYLDRATFFANDKPIDDTKSDDIGSVIGVRGVQYRAALEREAILLAGLVAAHRSALGERDSDEGGLGAALAVVGNLLGGGGGASSKADPSDLNTFFDKVNTVAGTLDVAEVGYDVTHQAGIDLHGARATYKTYLKGEIDKRKQPAPADPGLLAGMPLVASILPPEIGHIFTLVEKMGEKAFDIYVGIVLELTQLMMPAMEDACRAATIDAVQRRSVPVFDIWFPPAPPNDPTKNDLVKPVDKPTTGLGFVDSAIGSVLDPVNSGIGSVNKATAPVIDFLTAPGQDSPGGPFLDQVFEQIADKYGYLAKVDGKSLGDVAWTAIRDSFGFDLPDFVQVIVTRVMQAHADFLRGVYGKLVGMDPTKGIFEADLVAAGREHLVRQLVESLLHGVGFIDKIRDFKFNLDVLGPISKTLSGEALYQRAMEFLNEELTPHLDGIVELLMKDFARRLEDARVSALDDSLTMEVYLGLLPSLHALLFRKTFFPIWDLMVNTIFSPVSKAVQGVTGKIGDVASSALGVVQTVRTDVLRVKKVIDTALTEGANVGLGGTNLDKYADDLASKVADPTGASTPGESSAFPFTFRKTSCTSKVIDDATLQAVTALDKWRDDEPVGGPVAPAAKGGAAASEPAAATSGGAG
jgi:hypothetical protein